MKTVVTRLLAALGLLAASGGLATAADYVLDDVTLATGAVAYRASRVEVSGARISRDDMLKLLSADNATSPADRFGKLDAARIFIPEFVSETRAAGYLQRVVYRDLALAGVVQGLAATVDSTGGSVESQHARVPGKGRIGAFHAEGVDFRAIAELTTEARVKADEPRRVTTALFSIDGMEADLPDGARIRVGRMAGKNFGGRRLAAPMSSLIDLTPKPDAGPASPEAARAIAAMLGDLLSSVELASFEVNDIAIAPPADAQTPAATSEVKRIAFDTVVDGKFGLLAIEGLSTRIAAEPLRIGRVAVSGLDLKSSLDAGVAGRTAFPRFDRLDIADVAGVQNGGAFGLARLTVEARDWLASAPSSLKARVEHAVVSLAGAAAARAALAAALGYDRLDLSGAFDMKFDAANSELALAEFSFEDAEVGAARLSARFDHAAPAIFGADLERAKAAASALVFVRAALRLRDHGVIARAVAAQARQSGKAPAAVRDDLIAATRALLRTLLLPAEKNDPRVERLGDAAATFLTGGKTLDISVTAPQGLGVIDLMMLAQLGSLIDRMTIEARAQ